MKISLVIPSTQSHFKYLDCILSHYLSGTVPPNEVIISLSNSHLVDKELVNNLENKFSKLFENFLILRHTTQIQEGPNRGEGSKVSKFDYITYHDSDDIPHPQRIEIIKYFFSNFDILHLNHSYSYNKSFNKIEFNQINFVHSQNLFDSQFGVGSNFKSRPIDFYVDENDKSYGAGLGFAVCGGPTTIHRKVLDSINWNEERILSYDFDFCMDTLFYLNKSMIIDAPLIWYNKIGNCDWACK
jgi:hypothetical protein